ncbi:phosphate acyltransferase [Caballeronia grimmiae]
MDVPTYPKPLLVTDAAVNIVPRLGHKRDFYQNAVDLLHLLGNERPSVAVPDAFETANPKMSATIEAASLTVMAMRCFDNAISAAATATATATKGILSPVAGKADILLVHDLEVGNMLAK